MSARRALAASRLIAATWAADGGGRGGFAEVRLAFGNSVCRSVERRSGMCEGVRMYVWMRWWMYLDDDQSTQDHHLAMCFLCLSRLAMGARHVP